MLALSIGVSVQMVGSSGEAPSVTPLTVDSTTITVDSTTITADATIQ
jgi:hypothetical protein